MFVSIASIVLSPGTRLSAPFTGTAERSIEPIQNIISSIRPSMPPCGVASLGVTEMISIRSFSRPITPLRQFGIVACVTRTMSSGWNR